MKQNTRTHTASSPVLGLLFLLTLGLQACESGGGDDSKSDTGSKNNDPQSGEQPPPETAPTDDSQEVAGVYLKMDCKGFDSQENTSKSHVGCSVLKDDGTKYDGEISNLDVDLTTPGGEPVLATVEKTDSRTGYDFVFDVDQDDADQLEVEAQFLTQGEETRLVAVVELTFNLATLSAPADLAYGEKAIRSETTKTTTLGYQDNDKEVVAPEILELPQSLGPFTFDTTADGACSLGEISSSCTLDVMFKPETIGSFSKTPTVVVANGPFLEELSFSTEGSGALLATKVIGQLDLSSGSQNALALDKGGLSDPRHIEVSDDRVYVADTGNNRVLFWDAVDPFRKPSESTGHDPNGVLGQADLTSSGSLTTGADSIKGPFYFGVSTNSLVSSDYIDNRALVWSGTPTSSASADAVVGQDALTDNSSNSGGSVSAAGLDNPRSAHLFDGYLITADTVNNRVLVWDSVPTSNGTSADYVFGQTDFTSTGSAGDTQPNQPSFATAFDQELYAVDTGKHRILVWSDLFADPLVSSDSGTEPDRVIGQTDFTGASENAGGSVTASSLASPVFIRKAGDKLFVADKSNHRILVYDTADGITNGMGASHVIGQRDCQSAVAGLGAGSLEGPTSVFVDTTSHEIYVVDKENNRVVLIPYPESSDWGDGC